MRSNPAPAGNRGLRIRAFQFFFLLLGIAVAVSFVVRGSGSQVVNREKLSVEDPRPLAKAVGVLEARHGWVITYEDPPYANDGEVSDVTETVRRDLHQFKPGKAPRVLVPKGGALSFEYDVTSQARRPDDPMVILRGLLDAYAANTDAARFRLERSGRMIHVIPTAYKNTEGVLASHDAVLDAVITLPAGERTGIQILHAISAGVSQATRTRVEMGAYPAALFLNHREKQEAVSTKARHILVSLLESTKGGPDMTWQLLYDPGMKTYFLNILPVSAAGG